VPPLGVGWNTVEKTIKEWKIVMAQFYGAKVLERKAA
jgi:hypothetical protein